MPDSPLIAAGAQVQPTAAAPLHTNEFFTGMWTNGNPLGPGAVPYLYSKYWSASRFDRLIGGGNVEISTHLTPIRRPGSSIYNSSLFPPVNRIYEWRGFGPVGETIRVIISCDDPNGNTGNGSVRDATGPNTNTLLQQKAWNAGKTSFVAVGNYLYWGDGAETAMTMQSTLVWTPGTQYNDGDWIIDSNGNVQEAVGQQTANIVYIQTFLEAANHCVVTLYLDDTTPFDIPNGIPLYLSGLTTLPGLNGTTLSLVQQLASLQIQATSFTNTPTHVLAPETGTVTTGTAISGSTEPAWLPNYGDITTDGTLTWINRGSPVGPWGGDAPTTAPTVTQMPAPEIYPQWAPATWYSPYFYILDSNAALQQLIQGGTLGPAQPGWATAVGAVTNDGTAQWKCVALNVGAWWAANQNIAAGAVRLAYVSTVTTVGGVATTTSQATVFIAQNGGVTGASEPNWISGLNAVTTEGTGLAWQNAGAITISWANIGANAHVSIATSVLDNNGYIEAAQLTGITGSAEPTWAAQSGFTKESPATNPQLWLNTGPYSPAGTNPVQYAYSGKDSITGAVTTASPLSLPFTNGVDTIPVVQGLGVPKPPYDRIVIWRTMQGGSTLYELDEINNPGAGFYWTYQDRTTDQPSGNSAGLNTLIQAPIAGLNNPPPADFIPQCYYLGRIWGFSKNLLLWSNGPAQGAAAGSGDQGFSGLNQFQLPSLGVTVWPTSIGLIVWTKSDVWAVLGQGTYDANGSPISPFYMVQFQQGCGLGNQDGLAINGSTGYAMLTSHQVVSMDPGAGETEVGFPIADLFDEDFDPTTCYLCWHQARSKDTALYVSDGNSLWFRMAATAAPESGTVWSPTAMIAAPGQVKALASIEVAPGEKALLIGPSVNANPILRRDLTVFDDAGYPYGAWFHIASVVLAQPGSGIAGVQFVVVEEKMIEGALPIQVQLLFDEIEGGDFRTLRNVSRDPPTMPKSKTVQVQRLWAGQDADTLVKCRHFQQTFSWPAEAFPNELYTNTVYGRLPEKARR